MFARPLVCLALALARLPFASAAPPPAAEARQPFAPVDLRQLEGLRRELTLRMLTQVQDPGLRQLVASRLGPDQTRLPLPALLDEWARLWPEPRRRAFADRIRELDQDLRERMGIAETSTSVLALEVVWPEGQEGPLDWDRALFAVRPAGGAAPAWVEAYDRQGAPVSLEARVRPQVPVLLAGVDRREAVRAGVETVNRGLRQAGLAGPEPAAQPVDCLKLTAVRVGKGFESWWWSGLEPYLLASGIDPAAPKPSIRLVQLPYLQHEERDYHPDQVVLFWTDYRFAAANLQFWDHEDATSYKALLDAVIKGATAALAVAGMPQFALIPAIADAILQAMPASWWGGWDTLMDTFYTLEKGAAGQDLAGAAGRVRISLEPYLLQPQA